MKKLYFIFTVIILLNFPTLAQLSKTSWAFEVGGTYPRFISVSGTGYSANTNFGGYIALRRMFTEHLALRLSGSYIYMTSNYYDDFGGLKTQNLNHLAGNLDVVYNFMPCETATPFFAFGLGITNFTSDNSYTPTMDANFWGYQMNLGMGVEWKLSDDFSLNTEAEYITASNNKIDGNDRQNENTKGLLGGNGDTYMKLNAGIMWYFLKGEPSELCDKCPEGVREVIREVPVVSQTPPTEIVKVVKDTIYIKEPTLFGVHFEFDKYSFSPESYPILEHSVKVLKENPDIRILITGHTDSYGTNDYNKKLSDKRVSAVYDYLTSNGISANRISKESYGETKHVRENDTAINRAFNRRVEFIILSK